MSRVKIGENEYGVLAATYGKLVELARCTNEINSGLARFSTNPISKRDSDMVIGTIVKAQQDQLALLDDPLVQKAIEGSKK